MGNYDGDDPESGGSVNKVIESDSDQISDQITDQIKVEQEISTCQDLIPRMGSSLHELLGLPGCQRKDLGNSKPTIDFLNMNLELYLTGLDFPYLLKSVWVLSGVSETQKLEDCIEALVAKREMTVDPKKIHIYAVQWAADIISAKDLRDHHYYETATSKYKPVAKKVNPVSAYDPGSIVPMYKALKIPELEPIPTHPQKLEEYTEKFTKERVNLIVEKIPLKFLSKSELELLLEIVLANKEAFAFTDTERGMLKEGFSASNKTLNNPRQRDLPCLIKGN
jgi:hypothetical protein